MKLKIKRYGCLAICCAVLHGCQSATQMDFGGLAQRPPHPYAVLVTGGTFLSGGDSEDPAPFRNTFTTSAMRAGEVLPLAQIVDVLRDARIFVRSEIDVSPPEFRAEMAETPGPLDLSREANREFLSRARDLGADYLLVVRGLRDGRVTDLGTNDRWPWTFALWLVFGIGAVIPDHSFETAASLEISLRDLQTGKTVPGTTRIYRGGPLDLSLVSRGSSWWWLKMIVVPPFWIGSDQGEVVRMMRRSASQRLLFSFARDLKDASFLNLLRGYEVARTSLLSSDAGLRITITAKQSLSYVRLRMNRQDLSGELIDRFEAELLASESNQGVSYFYHAVLPLAKASGQLQVLLQTVGGEVATSTHLVGER